MARTQLTADAKCCKSKQWSIHEITHVGSNPTLTTELKRSSIPPTRDRIPIHAWTVGSNTLKGTRPRDGARLNGKMAEWLNAPVLKTGNCNRFWGSNPCLSANCRVVKWRTLLVYTPTCLVGAENEIDKWYGLTTKPAYFVIY